MPQTSLPSCRAVTPTLRNGGSRTAPRRDRSTAGWAVRPGYDQLIRRLVGRPAASRTVGPSEAGPLPTVRPPGSVREAFQSHAAATLFGTEANAIAERALSAGVAFGFTREELRRLGCGLYAGPDAVRTALLAAGFDATAITLSRLVADDTGRSRDDLSGCLVVPVTDPTGRLVDFLFLLPTTAGGGFERRTLLYGAARSGLVAAGLQLALSRPAGRADLVLVDDPLEALLLQARGFHAVAAAGGPGAKLTPRRWEELAGQGVTRVTLAFRRDAGHAAAVRDALAAALRARSVPEVWVAGPLPTGEPTLAGVLRRSGQTACAAAVSVRSLGCRGKGVAAA